MKGLEVSEVRLSNVECNNRIDAECYKKINIFYHQIIDNYTYELISDFAEVTDGEHGSPELDENSGIAYLSGHNVKDNILDLNDIRYCSKNLHNRNMRSALSKNNVLLSIVGTVGNSSVVYKELEANTDRNVATIKKISTTVNPYYLSTFLNSKYGRKQTEILSTGNVQPLLNLNQVKSIKVCLPSLHFQSQIETRVELAHSRVEESKQLYTVAENQLLSELGLNDWQPENQNVNIKTLKESFLSSGRLDAEYYQSKYDEIEQKIKSYKGGFDIIFNQFSQNNDVCNYEKSEYNYIEIGDVNVGDGSVCSNKILTNELPDNAKRVLHFNDILISKVRPYRGAVAIINIDDNDLIGSGAFTVLRENGKSKKEVLQVLLRTQIYKDWLLKWNVGSSYPVIKDEDILNLPIPIIPAQIQDAISAKIQQSFALKAESKRLLEEAKLMVEQEIEKVGK